MEGTSDEQLVRCPDCGNSYPQSNFTITGKDKSKVLFKIIRCRKCHHRKAHERRKARSKMLLETGALDSKPKRCTHCKEEKARSEFSVHIGNYDGRRSWCIRCDFYKCWIRKFQKFGATHDDWSRYCSVTHCECCGIQVIEGRGNGTQTKCQDHDHERLSLRGVICSRCNLLEGRIRKGVVGKQDSTADPRLVQCVKEYMGMWDKKMGGNQMDHHQTHP